LAVSPQEQFNALSKSVSPSSRRSERKSHGAPVKLLRSSLILSDRTGRGAIVLPWNTKLQKAPQEAGAALPYIGPAN